ncbi:hypothetical protein [Chryseobacterium sp. KLBC 52]|uniref:hypothetical protein n=1 Tax=Chryseobacterium sp. KLBC 52 TaxID=1862702 RepID=UPI000E0C6D03|nr:hypothetical protein [Chryseobacterium sp. KLBC 52]
MKKILLTGLAVIGGVLTAKAQCKPVTALAESFDTWKDINKCWTAQSGKAMLYASDKRIIFYSMSNPREDMYLVTPEIKAGTYTLSLDLSDNGGETTLELFSVDHPSDVKTYTSITRPSKITGEKKTFTVSLKKDAHLGLKVMLNGVHQAVYMDNLSLQAKK